MHFLFSIIPPFKEYAQAVLNHIKWQQQQTQQQQQQQQQQQLFNQRLQPQAHNAASSGVRQSSGKKINENYANEAENIFAYS